MLPDLSFLCQVLVPLPLHYRLIETSSSFLSGIHGVERPLRSCFLLSSSSATVAERWDGTASRQSEVYSKKQMCAPCSRTLARTSYSFPVFQDFASLLRTSLAKGRGQCVRISRLTSAECHPGHSWHGPARRKAQGTWPSLH